MDPGGDSGAKVVSEGLLRCSGSALWVDLAPFWGPFGTHKSINVGIDFVIYFVICFCCCWSVLESILEQFWCPKSVQKRKYRNVEIVVLCM